MKLKLEDLFIRRQGCRQRKLEASKLTTNVNWARHLKGYQGVEITNLILDIQIQTSSRVQPTNERWWLLSTNT